MLQCPNCAAPIFPEQTEEYQPISVWGYIGYMLLFLVPVAGVIFALATAFSSQNRNVRNFSRAYLCMTGVLLAACILFCALIGAAMCLDYMF